VDLVRSDQRHVGPEIEGDADVVMLRIMLLSDTKGEGRLASDDFWHFIHGD